MHCRLLVTGGKSAICKALLPLLPETAEVIDVSREMCDLGELSQIDALGSLIRSCDRAVLAHGILANQAFLNRSDADLVHSLKVNLLSTVRVAEIALENPSARIVIVGSESGVKGSYDVAYALAKAGLHKYVEERRTRYPGQQLVAVAPSTIVDCGMTLNRADQDRVARSVIANPKRRGLRAKEVARLIHFLLFVDEGYLNNTVIQCNGGKLSRMLVEETQP